MNEDNDLRDEGDSKGRAFLAGVIAGVCSGLWLGFSSWHGSRTEAEPAEKWRLDMCQQRVDRLESYLAGYAAGRKEATDASSS